MVTSGSTTATSATSSPGALSFQPSGMTVAEVESAVAAILGWSTSDATSLARIDTAITLAGQEAATWRGAGWWWSKGSNTFSTVASTASYNLRTVNTAAMQDLYAPTSVYAGTHWKLQQLSKDRYDQLLRHEATSATGEPTAYALAGNLDMYLWLTPGAVYTIHVNYIKRHSKITSAGSTDGALIVPEEFRRGVYVDGAVAMIKADQLDQSFLANDAAFQNVMRRMVAAAPEGYDAENYADRFPDARDSFDHQHIVVLPLE